MMFGPGRRSPRPPRRRAVSVPSGRTTRRSVKNTGLPAEPTLRYGVGGVEHGAAGRGLGHAVGLLHGDAAVEPGAQGRQRQRTPRRRRWCAGRRGRGWRSRARGPCASSMVGTAKNELTRCSSITASVPAGSKPADDHRATAAQQGRVDRAVEAADVEQRGQGQRALVGAEVETEQLVGGVPRHVAVGEHRALGLPGGAGGVHDQARVVEGDRLVARLRRQRRPAAPRRGASPAPPAAGGSAAIQARTSGSRSRSASASATVVAAVDDHGRAGVGRARTAPPAR